MLAEAAMTDGEVQRARRECRRQRWRQRLQLPLREPCERHRRQHREAPCQCARQACIGVQPVFDRPRQPAERDQRMRAPRLAEHGIQQHADEKHGGKGDDG